MHEFRQAVALILFIGTVVLAASGAMITAGLLFTGAWGPAVAPLFLTAGLAYLAWRQWAKVSDLIRTYPTERRVKRVQAGFGNRTVPPAKQGTVLPRAKEEELLEIPTGASPAHALFLMEYRDAEGNYSRRRITVRRADPVYLYAYCHERRALRTFIYSRIISLVDMFTGEIIDDLDEALALKRPAIDRAIDKLENEVLALVYVSRSDGRMVKAERAVIIDHIRNRLPGETFAVEELDKRVARIWCDAAEFRRSLKALAAATVDVREGLVLSADRLVRADRKVSIEEERALSKLEKFLLPERAGGSDARLRQAA